MSEAVASAADADAFVGLLGAVVVDEGGDEGVGVCVFVSFVAPFDGESLVFCVAEAEGDAGVVVLPAEESCDECAFGHVGVAGVCEAVVEEDFDGAGGVGVLLDGASDAHDACGVAAGWSDDFAGDEFEWADDA